MSLIITTTFGMYTYVKGWWLDRYMGGVLHWRKTAYNGRGRKIIIAACRHQRPGAAATHMYSVTGPPLTHRYSVTGLGDRTPSPPFFILCIFYHIFLLLFLVNLGINLIYIYCKNECLFLYQTCSPLKKTLDMHLKFCMYINNGVPKRMDCPSSGASKLEQLFIVLHKWTLTTRHRHLDLFGNILHFNRTFKWWPSPPPLF